MKRVLFIDRDGTLVVEPPVDYQLDSLEKLEFRPRVFQSLAYVAARLAHSGASPAGFDLGHGRSRQGEIDGPGTPDWPPAAHR